jgi:hypothetical protein
MLVSVAELEGFSVELGGGIVDDGVGVGVGDGVSLCFADSFEPLPLPLPEPEPADPDDFSKTTKLAFTFGGTVTTQKLPPPAPSVLVPSISLTLCLAGSTAQGRPLQPGLSQTISTPHVGIFVRNGVSGSR